MRKHAKNAGANHNTEEVSNMKNNRLFRAITNTRLDALPQDLIAHLKYHILGAIGVSLAGAQTKTGQEIIAAAKMSISAKRRPLSGTEPWYPLTMLSK